MDLFNDLSGTKERCPHLRGAQARAAARLAGRVVGPEAAPAGAEVRGGYCRESRVADRFAQLYVTRGQGPWLGLLFYFSLVHCSKNRFRIFR